jgi:hypothetical protein
MARLAHSRIDLLDVSVAYGMTCGGNGGQDQARQVRGTKSYSPMPCRTRKTADVSPALVTRCGRFGRTANVCQASVVSLLWGLAERYGSIRPRHKKCRGRCSDSARAPSAWGRSATPRYENPGAKRDRRAARPRRAHSHPLPLACRVLHGLRRLFYVIHLTSRKACPITGKRIASVKEGARWPVAPY